MEPNNFNPSTSSGQAPQNNFVPPTPTPRPIPSSVSTFVPPARPVFVPPAPVVPPTPPVSAPKVSIPTAPITPTPSTGSGQANVPHKANLKTILTGILILFVILGGIWIFYQNKTPKVSEKVVAQASAGTLVTGFSPSLILVPDATIISSTNTNRNSPNTGNLDVLFTKYSTKVTLDRLFTLYNAYLTNNDYTITKSNVSDDEKSIVIFATKGVDSLSVSFSEEINDVRNVNIILSKSI